ncbi:uncharacterized protein LOC124918396 [Impatiens glandulifera]|uniref:uncharacterized protein LOC124918396 n=1 Tax=Impatiens glandulifera TaxID=253017 RepID=UPI001FB1475A|nr:uncharacterized protein LOC124918396 [Impatiens glandulifera]
MRMKNNLESAYGASSYQIGGKPSTRSKQPSAFLMSTREKRTKTVNESEASSSSLKSSNKKDSESVDSRLWQGLGVLAATPMSSLSTPSTILRKPSRSCVSKEKKTKASRASKSVKNASPIVQTNLVAAGATESSQPEQGAVLTLVAGESTIPAPKDSLVAGKVPRVELPAELCKEPQSAFELMRSKRQSGGIVIGEPRIAPKPVEVVGKAEKLEIFESWFLERLSSKYNDSLSNSTITKEWKKRVANEKKVLKRDRTSEVAEALKRKDFVEACLYGKALFPIFEARKANFNPFEKGSEVEVKVLKKLNDILDGYVSVASRHIHGADCSSAEPLNDDEAMDILNAEKDADELDDALVIEFENLSPEERRILDQPIQEFPNEEEEERAEEEIEEEEQDEAAKKAEKNQLEQSLQIHINFESIKSMVAESEEISSPEESSIEGNKVLRSMRSLLSSIQKTMTQAMNTKEEEREGFSKIIKFEKQLFSCQSVLLNIERQFNDEHHKETLEEFSLINSPRVYTSLTVANTLMRMKNNLESAYGASSYQIGGKPSTRSKQPSAFLMSTREKRTKTVNESEASSSSLKSSNKKDSESVDSRLWQGLGVLAATPMSSLSTPSTILRKPSRSCVSKEKKTKASRASKSVKNASPIVQTNLVAAGATESSQPEQGAVLTLVAGESTIPAPKDSLVAGKVPRVELPAELCKEPQSAFELMRSKRQSGGIVIGEPRIAPKPVEVVGKAEKLEIFESWFLERLSSKYNDSLSNSTITKEWKKRVANENKVLKRDRTSEVAEALKRKDFVEACLYGKALFPIFEARKANFNPFEKGSEVEVKVLKKLNDILDGYVSVASRHIHGADCSSAEPLNDDEAMDILNAEKDADELDDALVIEFENLSPEERRILDQPIQEFPNEEEEERAEEEIEEEEQDEAAKKAEKNQLEQSLQIHINFESIKSMVAESEEISSPEESSIEGNKVLRSMRSLLSSIQKTMTQAMNTKEEEREGFSKIIKVLTEFDNTLKKNIYETHVANLNFS